MRSPGLTTTKIIGLGAVLVAAFLVASDFDVFDVSPGANQTIEYSAETGGSHNAKNDTVTFDPKVILVPRTSEIHQYPYSFAWEKVVEGASVLRVRVGINRHPDDSAIAPSNKLFMYSDNRGKTWSEHQPSGGIPRLQLSDGTLVNFGYATSFSLSRPIDQRQIVVSGSRSTDGGDSWTRFSGVVRSDFPVRKAEHNPSRARLYLHERAIEGLTGAVYQPAFGQFVNDAHRNRRRAVLLETRDLGDTWIVRSTIAYDQDLFPDTPNYHGFSEPAVVRLADNSLLAVMRTTGSGLPALPLYFARSTDDGITWSSPAQVVVGSSGEAVTGINPKLRLLPNGALVLLTGRDCMRLYVSFGGSGESWSGPYEVSCMGYESGNGGMEVIGEDRVLIVGDRRSDRRPPKNDSYAYEIWSRTATITPGVH